MFKESVSVKVEKEKGVEGHMFDAVNELSVLTQEPSVEELTMPTQMDALTQYYGDKAKAAQTLLEAHTDTYAN